MIIYSEILDKTFDSVDECIDAEYAYKMAEKKAAEEKAEYDKKCEDAYQKAIAACDEYLKLVGVDLDIDDNDDDYDDEDNEWEKISLEEFVDELFNFLK